MTGRSRELEHGRGCNLIQFLPENPSPFTFGGRIKDDTRTHAANDLRV
jgi:hypothetical protein